MAYTQKGRMSRVYSPLGEDALLVQRLSVREKLSGLFTCELQLLSESNDLAFASIVGKPVAVSVALASGSERWFHGIVSRFTQGAGQGRFVSYRAELVPWLWILTRRVNCRIFQHKSVPDIAKKIFSELGMNDFKLELNTSYPEREYCVQYRETDFAFLSRLFEEEGIAYYFEHEEKAHTLVLFDSPEGNRPCPEQQTAIYESASDAGGTSGDIRDLCFERELRSGGYALTDFNFEQPRLSLMSNTRAIDCVGSNPKLEIYDYPGVFLQPGEGEKRVRCRMEAEECASIRVTAQSNAAAFAPGYRFTLKGHDTAAYNQAYLLTEVIHSLTETPGDDAGGAATYENTLGCIPHSIPYRPQRITPRPVVQGVQTATVVGASGKEIDVDKHARVVVQFHWDREGERDEKSSCRVRVAQNWAGKGWGLIAHPRIGQEVIVEFLEGDPDRPIITGRVYNGEQVPPYALPANSTQSGIKSRSSLGATPANFNEIMFEDKKGEELVYIQAEKDRDTLTKNDDSQEVGHDRTREVGNDETVSIKRNRKVTVGKDHDESIGENESLSVGKNRSRNVGDNETVQIGKNQTLTIEGARMLTVQKNQTIEVTKDQEETVGGRYKTSVTKEYFLTAKKIQLVADDEISIVTGKAEIVMKRNGNITINGAKISIKGSGDVTVKGSKIGQN